MLPAPSPRKDRAVPRPCLHQTQSREVACSDSEVLVSTAAPPEVHDATLNIPLSDLWINSSVWRGPWEGLGCECAVDMLVSVMFNPMAPATHLSRPGISTTDENLGFGKLHFHGRLDLVPHFHAGQGVDAEVGEVAVVFDLV